MAKSTQVEKIIRYMASNRSKEWWYAPDFQKQNTPSEFYVGYEATARISDILRQYDGLMEVKREGRFRFIKLKSLDQIPLTVSTTIVAMIQQAERG